MYPPLVSATVGYIITSLCVPSFCLCHSWLHRSQPLRTFLWSVPQLVTAVTLHWSLPAGYIITSQCIPSFGLCHSWLHHSKPLCTFLWSVPQLVTAVVYPPLVCATVGYIITSQCIPSFGLCHSWLHHSQPLHTFLWSVPQLVTAVVYLPLVCATFGYITASLCVPSFGLWHSLLHHSPLLCTLLWFMLQLVPSQPLVCHSWSHHSQTVHAFHWSVPQLVKLQPVFTYHPLVSATVGYTTASFASQAVKASKLLMMIMMTWNGMLVVFLKRKKSHWCTFWADQIHCKEVGLLVLLQSFFQIVLPQSSRQTLRAADKLFYMRWMENA